MKLSQQAGKWLSYLPRSWRHDLLRRSFRLTYEWPPELQLKLATTPTELEAAFKLTHDFFVRHWSLAPSPTGLKVLPQHLMPQTSVLIAVWEGRVVGTVTLISDNPLGLPLDRSWEPGSIRIARGRVGELTALAIAPEFHKGLTRVFFPLLKFAVQYARDRAGLSRIVAAVHPSSMDVCEAILGASPIIGAAASRLRPRPREEEGLKPVFVDLERFDKELETLYKGHCPTTDLSRYLAAPIKQSLFQLPARDYHYVNDASITPATMETLMFGKARAGDWLTQPQRLTLAQYYPGPNYARVLGVTAPEIRAEWRAETLLPSRIELSRSRSEIWDVSRNGLRLVCPEKLEVGDRVKLRATLNRSLQAFIEAEVRWAGPRKTYGLRIESCNSAWQGMIKHLEARWQAVASGASFISETG